MSKIALTPEEIIDLTGYKTPQAQMRALRSLGVRCAHNGNRNNPKVMVLRADVANPRRVASLSKQVPHPQFAALRRSKQ